MTAPAKSSIPYFVSLDVDHDVSTDTLIVTLDPFSVEAGWVTATYEATPPVTAPSGSPAAGFARFWWSFMSGTGNGELPLIVGVNRVHGHLTDTPGQFYTAWNVTAAAE